MGLFSCGGSKSTENTTTGNKDSVTEEACIDCQQLVLDYEGYANDFAVSVGKWQADPSDEIAAAQIEELSIKIEEVGKSFLG